MYRAPSFAGCVRSWCRAPLRRYVPSPRQHRRRMATALFPQRRRYPHAPGPVPVNCPSRAGLILTASTTRSSPRHTHGTRYPRHAPDPRPPRRHEVDAWRAAFILPRTTWRVCSSSCQAHGVHRLTRRRSHHAALWSRCEPSRVDRPWTDAEHTDMFGCDRIRAMVSQQGWQRCRKLLCHVSGAKHAQRQSPHDHTWTPIRRYACLTVPVTVPVARAAQERADEACWRHRSSRLTR